MHEGIAFRCDCGSCKDEPHYVKTTEAIGIGLSSDHEDPSR